MKKFVTSIAFLALFVSVSIIAYLSYASFQVQKTGSNPTDNLKGNSVAQDVPTFINLYTACTNFTSGVTIPLKDRQVFLDEDYTEVTITSREAWDKSQLPAQVLELEKKNYVCSPMPFEIEREDRDLVVNAQPAVTKVEWSCELEYKDFNYKYISSQNLDHKNILEDQNFGCEKRTCLDRNDEEDFVWFCTKSSE